MTPTTTTAETMTRRQFFYLAGPLAHSDQGSNIPFGNPSLRFPIITQTDLSVGVLTVLLSTGLGPMLGKFLKTADNFCAQARYFVHDAFATLRRKYSVASLLQKNIMVSAQNAFQDGPRALEAQMASEVASEGFLKAS